MIDVCIIGCGFSAISLIRELDRTRTEFQIISEEGNSVWDGLSKSRRLDFDLVSTYLTSFYSFDLVSNYKEDYYPTAKQFYDMHKRWRKVYENRIIRDFVTRVDNFQDHSVVFTKSGRTVKAKHIIICTGFRRAIHTDINEIDYSVSNKTFVFDTMGDSANLIISKLIPNNNKIIVRTNGFFPLDKLFEMELGNERVTYALDQLEYHNFRYVSHECFSSIAVDSPIGLRSPFLLREQFPVIARDEDLTDCKPYPPNGRIFTKYWPISLYSHEFGNNLEASIAKGYLLNDIAMWLYTGKVIATPKDTPIDLDKKTITYAGIERSFHQYIKGDTERPRLPTIMMNGVTPYRYLYRNNFMGVIPKQLNNIYTIGYTRPMSGGNANITEMQGLFVHKLVTQSDFHKRITHNLDERLAAYNSYYYSTSAPQQCDHTVYYGFYTDDMARLIGIDYKPSECKSLKDLIFYYAFPNNTFKYRLKGEYAVDGVKELIETVNRQYHNFVLLFAYILRNSTMELPERIAWIENTQSYFFNDMRHKEAYKLFLEHYIKTYRRVMNAAVDEIEDEEWDAMASKACETRDRVAQNIEPLDHSQFHDDALWESRLIVHLISRNQPIEDMVSQLDPKRRDALLAMLHPKEYDQPYLQP